jgi:pyruvate,orthophosphate dikinase
LEQKVLVFVRTEHMFFDEERILSVREMILSKTKEDRAIT